ncbi:MAG TPA: MarR family winged helix-turn-helix transcriptional regulator [Solirubrobacterales bacterium]|nr:MarR family winged helix-turn-helix transcriptional regulator [Solirubrobacterales bacterium]
MSPDSTDISRLALPGLFGIAAEAVLIEFRQELVDAGYGDVRPTHGCVFRFVREDGMRLTELASLAGMTKQSIGEVVDDLAALGYVKRVPDPADRRAKLICLTGKGEQAQRVAYRLFGAIERRWAERYGADRVAALRELLEEIATTEVPDLVPELSRAAHEADLARA